MTGYEIEIDAHSTTRVHATSPVMPVIVYWKGTKVSDCEILYICGKIHTIKVNPYNTVACTYKVHIHNKSHLHNRELAILC